MGEVTFNPDLKAGTITQMKSSQECSRQRKHVLLSLNRGEGQAEPTERLCVTCIKSKDSTRKKRFRSFKQEVTRSGGTLGRW